jgi:hypothetical protein
VIVAWEAIRDADSTAAVKYLEKNPSLPADTAAFDKASGVGEFTCDYRN